MYLNVPLVKKHKTSKSWVNDDHIVIPSTISNARSCTYCSLAEKDANTGKHALTLCLVSRQSAKPAIASAAHSLARTQTQTRNRRPRKAIHSRTGGTFQLSINQFDQLLDSESSLLYKFWVYSQGVMIWLDEDGLSSPDFMIVHPIGPDPSTSALELHGFPPWHIRLTEI